MRIVVVSDIHSNICAFSNALTKIKDEGFDYLVCLGDFFTYGPFPLAVLELMQQIVGSKNVYLIKGNHDQLYLDFESNQQYYKKVPEWLKESIDWTSNEIKSYLFKIKEFPWKESCEIENMFFAHANSFSYGDWSYLNEEDTIKKNLLRLEQIGFKIGIFGHTHRRSGYSLTREEEVHEISSLNRIDNLSLVRSLSLNAGSIGQPRNQSKIASYLNLKLGKNCLDFDWVDVAYDVMHYCEAILSLPLSLETKEKIIQYIVG